jgi:hypothetical protein
MENQQEEINEEQDKDTKYVDYGQILASWQFPEHTKHERSKKWYFFAFTLIAMLVTVSITGLNITFFKIAGQPFTLSIDKNYLLIVLLILFLILYLYYERKEIENITIFLTEDGVVFNNKLMEYSAFDHFYLVYFPPNVKNLYLQPKNILRPLIIIPLGDENPIEVREILLDYLKENLEKEEMPTSEALSKILKL